MKDYTTYDDTGMPTFDVITAKHGRVRHIVQSITSGDPDTALTYCGLHIEIRKSLFGSTYVSQNNTVAAVECKRCRGAIPHYDAMKQINSEWIAVLDAGREIRDAKARRIEIANAIDENKAEQDSMRVMAMTLGDIKSRSGWSAVEESALDTAIKHYQEAGDALEPRRVEMERAYDYHRAEIERNQPILLRAPDLERRTQALLKGNEPQ